MPSLHTLLLLSTSLLLAASSAMAQEPGKGNVTMQLFDTTGDLLSTFYGQSNKDDIDVNVDNLAVPLEDDDPFGCEPFKTGFTGDHGVLLYRGFCSYRTKVLNAQLDNAAFVIIVENEYGMYNTADNYTVKSPCLYNCELGEANTQDDCESQCGSGLCVANGFNVSAGAFVEGREPRPFCCVEDSLLTMNLMSSNVTADPAVIDIDAVFVGVVDGARLLERVADNSGLSLTAIDRPTMTVDPATVILCLLGTAVTLGASFRAAAKERHSARWVWGGLPDTVPESTAVAAEGTSARNSLNKQPVDAELEVVDLSTSSAISFLVLASVVLVGLFYLTMAYPRQAVIAICVLFTLGSIASLQLILFQPIVGRIAPQLYKRRVYVKWLDVRFNMVEIISTVLSMVLSFTWFACRHEYWAWVLLDTIAIAVSCTFLLTVKLPSLRVATVLLSVFFVYDIFMVFITPFIFNGRSVMVDVATAGRGLSNTDGGVCNRFPDEQMPMLYVIPKFDWMGGESLLGLGDVFIPGLLLTLAIRFDYIKAEKVGEPKSFLMVHKYYFAVGLAYFVGLSVTFVANLLQKTGQPALLYLVPCTLITFLVSAKLRGDFGELWTGAALKQGSADSQPPTGDAADRSSSVSEDAEASLTVAVTVDDGQVLGDGKIVDGNEGVDGNDGNDVTEAIAFDGGEETVAGAVTDGENDQDTSNAVGSVGADDHSEETHTNNNVDSDESNNNEK